MEIKNIKVKDILKYDNNIKLHPQWQIDQIKKSIIEFGFNDPIVLDTKNNIIEGHGRYEAILQLNYTDVPCIILHNNEKLNLESYRIIHNQLTLNTSFDTDILDKELNKIKKQNIDLEALGFDNMDYNDFFNDDELEIEDDLEEIKYINNKYICPNCNYIGDKVEFK